MRIFALLRRISRLPTSPTWTSALLIHHGSSLWGLNLLYVITVFSKIQIKVQLILTLLMSVAIFLHSLTLRDADRASPIELWHNSFLEFLHDVNLHQTLILIWYNYVWCGNPKHGNLNFDKSRDLGTRILLATKYRMNSEGEGWL